MSASILMLLRRYGVGLLAVVLLAGGVIVFWRADTARDVDNVGNHALVDDAGTTDVQSAIAAALVRVFTFDYSNPAPTEQAAAELLIGDARAQYDELFAALDATAAGQKLIFTTQVQVAAVQELAGDRAELLVFLDQASQRATDNESSVSAAQLVITAERVDGTWKVAGIRLL